jgi:hypothetical protein
MRRHICNLTVGKDVKPSWQKPKWGACYHRQQKKQIDYALINQGDRRSITKEDQPDRSKKGKFPEDDIHGCRKRGRCTKSEKFSPIVNKSEKFSPEAIMISEMFLPMTSERFSPIDRRSD